ncbi:gliding motility-associated C-terminal domain-containing protein [Tenacibaculum finnmarkense]|uniref:gliding motility-associated C-terminal domain-containing protein n=1 Tax=Tenacibaculum finnmarkense TaxID=2781243 RepID=UPI00187BBB52|nr:gliding motility-associated C-terminal domain-containing protein [Tenacibaculum finnmarkense]MBE7647784.1 T9SS type B sorting domain-containing protein [Tenacibaculum finnmarkense genomovar ulcerans]
MLKKVFFIILVIVHFSTISAENKIYAINNTSLHTDKHQNSLTEITLCEGDDLSLTAEFFVGATYKWFTSDNKTINSIDLVRSNISVNMAGIYLLTISNNGCNDTAEINIIVIPKPNAGTNGSLNILKGISPSEQELFNALGGNPEQNGVWTTNNNAYTYTVNSNTCKSTAKATVNIIEDVKITNAFTPNKDGINDTWVILSDLSKIYPKNKLFIFNRHGNKVYQAAPYKNNWDGIANSNLIINSHSKLPVGAYYYVLKLNDINNTAFKGWVYINY